MAKRRPDHQITQDNWDDEIEREEDGNQNDDEDEIKKRLFRKVKRRIAPASDETDANETGAKPATVFSNISMVSNKSSIFGGFGDAVAASAPKPFSFGSGFSSQQPASISSGISSTPFCTSSMGSSDSSHMKTDYGKSTEFITKLKDLNEAVLSCIKGHIDSGKACILTPIFKDYEKYIKELEDKDKIETTASPVKTNHVKNTPNTTPFTLSAFGSAKSTSAAASTSTKSASSVIPSQTQSASLLPAFSFDKPAAAPAPAFGAISSGFSFGNVAQTSNVDSAKTSEGANNGAAEDEDDEPPKNDFKQVVEDDSLYSKVCKVFVKDDGGYKDRGTGTLYIKNVQDKVQLIVRADTNLGNILLNILLKSEMPTKRLKNNLVLVCIPTPESEPVPKTVLVRVKTEDDAMELLEEIEKHKK